MRARTKRVGSWGNPGSPCIGNRRLVAAGPVQKEEGELLRGAGEALFVARPLDDFVPVAEAKVSSEHPLLVPEALEPLLQVPDLSGGVGIVALRKHVPELGAALGRALDLGLDLFQCVHVSSKRLVEAPHSTAASGETRSRRGLRPPPRQRRARSGTCPSGARAELGLYVLGERLAEAGEAGEHAALDRPERLAEPLCELGLR